MKRTAVSLLVACLATFLLAGAKPAHKLESVKKLPDGLATKVAATLDAAGHRIAGSKGALVEIWFAKAAAMKAGFKPTLNVKYPFTPGQLIGAIRVSKGQAVTDFKGQELKPGVYTLRYGQQPADGNHIGTSDTADFLLALPAKTDTDPKTIKLVELLHKRSAKSAGSTHPTIFSLLPANKDKKTKLEHNADKEFWILNATLTGSDKGKKTPIAIRMITIGKSEE